MFVYNNSMSIVTGNEVTNAGLSCLSWASWAGEGGENKVAVICRLAQGKSAWGCMFTTVSSKLNSLAQSLPRSGTLLLDVPIPSCHSKLLSCCSAEISTLIFSNNCP